MGSTNGPNDPLIGQGHPVLYGEGPRRVCLSRTSAWAIVVVVVAAAAGLGVVALTSSPRFAGIPGTPAGAVVSADKAVSVFSSFVTYGKICAPLLDRYWAAGGDEGYQSVSPTNLDDELSALEKDVVDQLKAIEGAGLVVNVLYRDRLLWSHSFGYKNVSDPDVPPDQDTVFMLGSLSKIFPVVQLLMMRNEGALSLDDEVKTLVPEFKYVNPFIGNGNRRSRGITWRMLASEMSGLPREAPAPCSIVCDMTTAEVLDLLATTSLVVPPNTVPSYSNVAYSLIGRLLERVTGQTFEEYMRAKVFGPLGMKSSGFVVTPDIARRMAAGYANGKPVENKDVIWNRPTGNMFSTARDLSAFMSFVTTLDRDGVLLDSDTVREFALPVFVNGDGGSGFGMPWEMIRVHDELVRFKGGYVASSKFQIGGFRTGVAFVPDLQLSAVALANSGGGDATTFVSLAMERLIPAVRRLQQHELRYKNFPAAPEPGVNKILGVYRDEKGSAVFRLELDQRIAGHPQVRFSEIDFAANYVLESLSAATAAASTVMSFRLHPDADGMTCLNMQVLAMEGPHLMVDTSTDGVVTAVLPDIAPGQTYSLHRI